MRVCEWVKVRRSRGASPSPRRSVEAEADEKPIPDKLGVGQVSVEVCTAEFDPKVEAKQLGKQTEAENQLWWMNFMIGQLNVGFGIGCLVIGLSTAEPAGKFKIAAITSYPDWKSNPQGPIVSSQLHYYVPFVALTSGIAWMSAAVHLAVLVFFPFYLKDLRSGCNRFRWIDQIATSSFMLVEIAMLLGVWDVHLLFLLGAINACASIFAYTFEAINVLDQPVDWRHFFYSIFAAACPWAVIISYASNADSASIPGYVWAIFFIYIIVSFTAFPINMFLQYDRVIHWYRDEVHGFPGGGYYFGEKVYQVLYFLGKTLVLWIVVGGSGTQQYR